MARQYKTGLIITGDASGGIRAIQATDKELGQLNRGFDQGSRRSKRFAQDVGGSSRELQLLRRVAAPVGAMIAGMFAGQALQNQIRFGDELNKLGLRIGAGAEALSEYRYVAEQAGVQFGTLATAWQRQTRRIAQATTQGTGEAVKALEALNLSARELSQLRPEDQFERIAGALQGVANEGHRTALAMALWDTEGVALLQVVNQGTAAMQQQREEARRLGLTISDETAQAMADYSSELTRLQAVGTGVSRQLLAELVPAMTTSLQATSEWIDEMGGAAAILDITKDAATGVAIVMAGRYAGAIVTSSAALTAKAAIVSTTSVALGVLTGATTRQAAAATAMAGATRIAGAAVGLLGGPVGVAVVAAGAIYTFREELGLTGGEAHQTSIDVDGLASAFHGLTKAQQENKRASLVSDLIDMRIEAGRLGTEITQISELVRNSGQLTPEGGAMPIATAEDIAKGRELRGELQGLLADIKGGTELLDKYDKALEGIGKTAGSTQTRTRKLSEASKEAQKAAEQHANALEALRREMNPGRAEAAKFAEQTATLTKALASGEMGLSEHGQAVSWAAQQYLRAATGADELEKQQKSLIQQYDRHHQKAQQLRSDYAQISQMYRAGVIDGDQYARMIANIRDEMNQLALDADPAAQDMARAWEEASNRIDETFADAFRGAFDSFEDFSDQLLDGFKRLLAELAYQAFLRPIVVSFTGQMGGALGIQGMGGGSVSGGISQVGGNLISTGQTLYKGYQWLANGGSTAAVAGQAGTAAVGYGSGWGSQVATGGYSGWAGSAAAGASQAAPGFSGGLPSWAGGGGQVGGWASGVATAGAGFAGGYLGGEVFGKSAEANAGATVGAMVGTYVGSVVPVIGNFLGAAIGSFIGSGIGSLFAHSPTKPRTEFVTRASDGDLADLTQDELKARDWYYGGHVAQGAFGDVGVTHSGSTRVHRAFDMDAGHEASQWAQDLADAAVEMDGFIASLARSDEEVSAMAAAVQELSVRSGKAENVIDHVLVDRPLAALDAVGLQISDRFRHMGVEDFAAELAILLGVTEQLKFTTDRLNIEFDLTADNVLVVAERMSMLAGGLDNLAAIQQGYYQVAFSEAERLGHQASDLQASLSAITDEVPTTVEALRELVEAQSLSSNEGQELALQLMQLAPALAQTRAAIEQQLAEAYQAELGRVPDTAGLTYWVDAVVSGAASLEDALWGIANSSEAASGSLDALLGQLRDAVSAETSLLAAERDAAVAIHSAQEEAARAALQISRGTLQAEQAAERERYQLAVDGVQALIDAERGVHAERMAGLNEQRQAISSNLADTRAAAHSLSQALSRLGLGTADELRMQRGQAVSELEGMRGGGFDQERLSAALSVVTQDSQHLFSTWTDWAREQGQTANLVSELEAQAAGQLSIEERQLEALTQQIEQAEHRHNVEMSGLDNQLAQMAEEHELVMESLGQQYAQQQAAYERQIASHRESIQMARDHYEHEVGILGSQLDEMTRQTSLAQGTYRATVSVEEAVRELSTALSRRDVGLPGFADGGIANGPASGYPVELHGTEAVIPLKGGNVPVRISAPPPMRLEGSPTDARRLDLSELLKEVQQMRQEQLAAGRAIADHSSRLSQLIERWERMGMPEKRGERA